MSDNDIQEPLLPPDEMPQPAKAMGLNGQSTLTAASHPFTQHMRDEGFAINTVKSFGSDLRLLTSFLGANQILGEIGTDELNKFLNWLVYERGVPCSPKSYARRITTMKVFFAWLHEAGVLPYDPAKAVVQHSAISPLPTIPTDEQIAQAVAASEAWRRGQSLGPNKRKADARPHLLLTLLLQTGIKKGEAMGLVLNHIEREEHNPQIFIRYKNPRLRTKERRLAIEPSWLDVLDEYVGQYNIKEPLFTCTPRNLEYILRDIGDDAGLERGLISFENLRWVSALTDMKNGMDHDLIREKQGLSKITWRETRSKLERLWEKQRIAAEVEEAVDSGE
ncbi:MAG: site-specific integrase [Chloroflexi bacterium]|nr:site-specific integrase [Chloroflexota bacterium]